MRKTLTQNNTVEKLEIVKETNRSFNLPDSIKPCVSILLSTSISKGDLYSRNSYCYLIATEFRKNNIVKSKAEHILGRWNELNNPPMSYSEIRSTIKSAYRTNYTYGCNSLLLEDFCLKIGGKK